MSAPLALVTGASGGIGQAGARRLGRTHDLFLADIAAPRLDAVVAGLRSDGLVVRGMLAGDLGEAGAARALVEAARATGPIGAVLHAAGLSPALADGETIVRANIAGTEYLLRALEAGLEPGLAVVLIASMAGHTLLPAPIAALLGEDPLEPHFTSRLAHSAGGLLPGPLAYCASKNWVIRAAERRAASWGQAGARIVSISPGLIDTPMGRSEMASTPGSRETLAMTPLGLGEADDIAAAAGFLCSRDARFITGCDLRVDGGVTPVFKAAMAA